MTQEQNNLLTRDDSTIEDAMHSLRLAIKRVDNISHSYTPLLGGVRYITDRELSLKLKVSRRTLQEYRSERIIPYIIFGGKTLYKETDVEQLLSENYHKAIK